MTLELLGRPECMERIVREANSVLGIDDHWSHLVVLNLQPILIGINFLDIFLVYVSAGPPGDKTRNLVKEMSLDQV